MDNAGLITRVWKIQVGHRIAILIGKCIPTGLLCFYRLQEKHVKEKQVEHQRNIIDLQEKLKKNQIQVSSTAEKNACVAQ